MQLTIRKRKGENWVSLWDDTPVACGHEDMTEDERNYEQIESHDAAAKWIEECLYGNQDDFDEVMVWRHDIEPGDMTNPVMNIVARNFDQHSYEMRMDSGEKFGEWLPQSSVDFVVNHLMRYRGLA